MTFQKGPSEVVIRAGRASKCGRFAMSFGPSEKIDGANLTNKPNEKRWENGLGEMSCKHFSKDLIVRAIYVKEPQLETQTATVAMQLWLFC